MAFPYAAELDLLVEAVRAGAGEAMARYGKPVETRRKADGSPVTAADMAVDAAIADVLRRARPDYAWLSEESADPPEQRRAALAWIVDPIDGTRGFLDRGDEFCIAAALTCAGAPVAAAILQPTLDRLYTASQGAGAFCNGERLTVSAKAEPERARIQGGKAAFRTPGLNLTPINALCLALARVASGEADAVASIGPKSDWDLASGALLVIEAGGIATQAGGEPFAFNGASHRQTGVLAAGPALHPLLQERLALRG